MTSLKLMIGNKRYSSWSLRPWLALKASGLPFETLTIPMNTPEFDAARSDGRLPAGRVPVLWAGDLCIWDSLAIIEYVAEQAPGMWPDNPQARAVARSMSAEMHAGFQALRGNLPMVVLRKFAGFTPGADAQVDITRIVTLWTQARAQFGADGPFLFGAFSAADCMFAPVVFRFRSYGVALPAVAQAYVDAMLAHAHLRTWVADAAVEPWMIDKYEAAA